MGNQIIVSSDPKIGGMIARVFQDIQKISDPTIIRKTIYEKSRQSHENNYWLGGLLSKASEQELFKGWGFADWKEYLANEVGIGLRTAQYFMSIYYWSAELSQDQRSRVENMPWSRVRELPKVCNSETADEWLDLAESATREELTKSIKAARKGKDSIKDLDDSTPQIKKFALFKEQLKNVEDALERAAAMADSSKEGNLLDLICTQFLAESVFANAPGKAIVGQYYGKLEKVLGTKTVVVDSYSGEILRGKVYLQKLVDEYIADDSEETT